MKNVVLAGKTIQLFLYCLVSVLFIFVAGTALAASMPAFERLDPLAGQLEKPTIVTLDSQGRIYVAETKYNLVRVYSQSGSYLHTLTGLDKPISLAVDGIDRIYVGNRERGNVEVYDADLNHLFNLGLGTDGQGTDEFGLPNDIEIDATGTIYVVDKDNSAIWLYNPDGTCVKDAGDECSSLAPQGNGEGELHHPISMAIDSVTEELVVLDRQERPDTFGGMMDGVRIQFLGMDGTFRTGEQKFGYNFADGELAMPNQMTVDSQSRVYISDARHLKVMVYDNDEDVTFLGSIAGEADSFQIPLGLTMGTANRLYVASSINSKVGQYGIDEYTILAARPASLSFEERQEEESNALQDVVIANSGNSAFNWTATTSESWLTLSGTQGSLAVAGSTSVQVGVNIEGLDAGEYQGRIVVSANAVLSEVINVELSVLPGPILSIAPGSLHFESTVGTTPAGQTLAVENIGGSTLYWNANVDQSWITVNETSGRAPFDLKVYADITSLPAGTYTGTVMVTKQGDNPAMQLIPVQLTLNEPTDPPVEPPDTGIKPKGKKWTVTQILPGTSLYGIWGSSKKNLFVVGAEGSIVQHDGNKWTTMESGTSGNIYGIWGSSDSEIYAVGDEGLVLQYDGSQWNSVSPVINETLRDTWGNSESAFYAVSRNGSVLEEFNSATETGIMLRGVWGSSGQDVFVVGESGTILNYNGTGWTSMDSDTTQWLNGIWGSSGSDVFAVGENGAIVHYDGTNWSAMDSGTNETLQSVWGSSGSDVFAVGANGLVLHYNGNSWYTVITETTEGLNDVWGDGKSVYAVGENGTVIYGTAKFPWMHIIMNINMVSQRIAEEKNRTEE